MTWQRRIPFKVDIAGVIEIMGSSLYSRIDTPIRELIQNAHDAVMRRRKNNLTYQGRIDVVQNAEEHSLTFSDDGVGLSPSDAEDYLGTLGVGITGLLKRGEPLPADTASNDSSDLIGQFGVGLFSAFMLADRLVVESRREGHEGVRWEAGPGTEIDLSACEHERFGTTVKLYLKPENHLLAEDEELLESIIKRYADFLTIPIHLNNSGQRANVINVAWFEPTADRESVELALENYFNETPLDVIPLRTEKPASIAGALYITPQRTPGFSDDTVVTVTIRRMVISRQIQGLLPHWASFIRGVLELHDCSPTASREDLVRNDEFDKVAKSLEQRLYEQLELMAEKAPNRLQAILAWHRYTMAGAALDERRLRDLLKKSYKLPTSRGQLTFDEILAKSEADPLFEVDADRVIWFNTDRRQERWVNDLFVGHEAPCVHALRSFEESLLASWVTDTNEESDEQVDLRIASPSAKNFAIGILGVRDMEEAPPEWQEFLDRSEAKIMCASFRAENPVMAFLNERYQLSRTFDELKKEGNIPASFQRLIDSHFDQSPAEKNEVVLNRNHRLVARALSQNTGSPLASVLRLLVLNALTSAGAATSRDAHRQEVDDLDWIAEALWGKD